MFAIRTFGYIEVLFHTFYYYWGKEYRLLYRGLRLSTLNRGSTVERNLLMANIIGHYRKCHNVPYCSQFVPPKFSKSIVFSFSWGHFNSKEKLKTMLTQKFGLTIKEHYCMLRYFLRVNLSVPWPFVISRFHRNSSFATTLQGGFIDN